MSGRDVQTSFARRRVATVAVIVAVFVVFVGRLLFVQVFDAGTLSAASNAELDQTVTLPAGRGAIYDRNGQPIAISAPETEIIADPLQIAHPAREAGALAPLLGQPATTLAGQLGEHTGYVLLARYVGSRTAAAVSALRLAGITESPTSERFSPAGELFQPLVGSVNAEGAGISGLEYEYNRTLEGHPGTEVVKIAPGGVTLPGGVVKDNPAKRGKGIELTIDPALQLYVRNTLAAEVQTSHATQGIALMLDSHTGAILAMVSLVAGSTPGAAPVPAPSELALTQVYEPGSVMKLTTFSGALTEGLITPTTVESVPDQLIIDGSLFHDAWTHPTEPMTATQIIDQSSNIGTIKIAERLGDAGVEQWIKNFGFDAPTGLHYPGTSPGILNPVSHWSPTAIGSTPIGQDEAVSALQLADAYNAIANGGMFLPPRLVEGTVGTNGHLHRFPAPAPRRVVSTQVDATITRMLTGVVSANGTAPLAAIPGYSAVGKTGTSQVPRTNAPGYIPGDYFGSFVGFAPTQHPAITAIVILKHAKQIYGGSVAAPVFSKIMAYALKTLGIPPTTAG